MAEKYYRSSFVATQPDGTKKQLVFTGKTQKEAERKRNKALAEYDAGLLVVNNKTTFARWVDEWMETYRKPMMSTDNYKQIKSMMKRVYTQNIGGMKISDIRLVHIQKSINGLQGSGSSLINKAYSNIRNLFAHALANGLINADPTMMLEKPAAKEESGRRSLTDEEKDLFLKMLTAHRRGAFFGIMYACGLRPGEARALTPSSVDSDFKNILITHAISKDDQNIKMPKTNAGRRTIPVPAWFQPLLRATVDKANKNNAEYLFVRDNGNYLDRQTYLRAWHSFLRQMDIAAGAETYRNHVTKHAIDQNLNPYHLRHTYATELAEKDVPIRTAQYLLGHSDISVTAKVYTHVTEKIRENAREKIDANNKTVVKYLENCN